MEKDDSCINEEVLSAAAFQEPVTLTVTAGRALMPFRKSGSSAGLHDDACVGYAAVNCMSAGDHKDGGRFP